MQALLSNLTAALLFIHTIVGCCWHHAHHGPSAVSSAAPAAKCCHHHHDQGGQPQQTPHPCQLECEGACQYIAPHKVRIDAPQCVALLDFAATDQALTILAVALLPSGGMLDSLHGAAPPLRTHLLHQVLLI